MTQEKGSLSLPMSSEQGESLFITQLHIHHILKWFLIYPVCLKDQLGLGNVEILQKCSVNPQFAYPLQMYLMRKFPFLSLCRSLFSFFKGPEDYVRSNVPAHFPPWLASCVELRKKAKWSATRRDCLKICPIISLFKQYCASEQA